MRECWHTRSDVSQVREEFLDSAGNFFVTVRGPKPAEHTSEEAIYGERGGTRQNVEPMSKDDMHNRQINKTRLLHRTIFVR